MELLDWRTDYLTWDNTEQVVVESARAPSTSTPDGAIASPTWPGPPTQTAAGTAVACPCGPNDRGFVPVTKRRPVRGAQKSPSGGVYVGYEAFWLIPSALLPASWAFKPKDVIRDGKGTRWTVLTTELNRHGATWKLGTVDLVLAAVLADSIDVQRPQITYDAAGTPVKAWPGSGALAAQPGPADFTKPACFVARGIAARVQRMEETVVDQRGIRAFEGKYEVTVAAPLAVTFEDRIAWSPLAAAGRTLFLDLTGTRHAGLIDELLTIDAELRP